MQFRTEGYGGCAEANRFALFLELLWPRGQLGRNDLAADAFCLASAAEGPNAHSSCRAAL
ncbi:hypothetical protein MPLSOD_120233 [Mesorhizobium sp. SOD10]|nr:hypothetical protein MPLSOD_120233 [Mesorhizobium sp. SOD10]